MEEWKLKYFIKNIILFSKDKTVEFIWEGWSIRKLWLVSDDLHKGEELKVN